MQDESDVDAIIPQVLVVVVEKIRLFLQRWHLEKNIKIEPKATAPRAAGIRGCV